MSSATGWHCSLVYQHLCQAPSPGWLQAYVILHKRLEYFTERPVRVKHTSILWLAYSLTFALNASEDARCILWPKANGSPDNSEYQAQVDDSHDTEAYTGEHMKGLPSTEKPFISLGLLDSFRNKGLPLPHSSSSGGGKPEERQGRND